MFKGFSKMDSFGFEFLEYSWSIMSFQKISLILFHLEGAGTINPLTPPEKEQNDLEIIA